MAETSIKDIEKAMGGSSGKSGKFFNHMRDYFSPSGTSGISNGTSFFLFMLVFHYFDVFVLINGGSLFRVFVFLMIALIYLPWVVYKESSNKIQDCSIYWILLAVTFILPYGSVIPFLSSIPGLYMFVINFSGVILIWFPPIPLYILFTEHSIKDWSNKAIVMLMIFWLIAAFAGIGPMQNSRFFPRKNKAGVPIDGWTEVKVRLELH